MRSFRVCFYSAGGSAGPGPARPGTGSGSARLSQQASFSRQSLVLLDVILLETHGDPLSHLQILLQARLGAARLLGLHVSRGEVSDAVHEAVLRHLVVRPQKLLKLFDLVGLGHLDRHDSDSDKTARLNGLLLLLLTAIG